MPTTNSWFWMQQQRDAGVTISIPGCFFSSICSHLVCQLFDGIRQCKHCMAWITTLDFILWRNVNSTYSLCWFNFCSPVTLHLMKVPVYVWTLWIKKNSINWTATERDPEKCETQSFSFRHPSCSQGVDVAQLNPELEFLFVFPVNRRLFAKWSAHVSAHHWEPPPAHGAFCSWLLKVPSRWLAWKLWFNIYTLPKLISPEKLKLGLVLRMLQWKL